jgi:hypothetical protein
MYRGEVLRQNAAATRAHHGPAAAALWRLQRWISLGAMAIAPASRDFRLANARRDVSP